MTQSRAGIGQLSIYAGLILIVLGVYGQRDAEQLADKAKVTPEDQRFGWDEPTALKEAPAIAAAMPKFAITDGDGKRLSGAGKSAELWKYGKLANGGKHIPTWRQESGDCVSMGWSNAIAYLQAFRICNPEGSNRNEVLKIPFPPYMYGVSRVQIGKRQLGRGAGSVGAWAAQGSQGYGVLPVDQAEALGFKYSGQLADQWGWTGPPKPTLDYGSQFRIKTIAQVKSWEDVRDALVHGFTVTVASNVGFEGGHYDKDGKRWLRPRGNWGHQMAFIGVEDREGREKGAFDINSWGENAHPPPLNDEPKGGFWVDWQTVQRMVQQGDSWAYSDFDGFPGEATADFSTFRDEVIESGDSTLTAAVVAAEQPTPEPVLKEVREMHAFWVSPMLMCLGMLIVLCGVYLKWGNQTRLRTAATLLIAAGIVHFGMTADAGQRRQARIQARQQACTPQAQAEPDDQRGQLICNGNSCRLVKPASKPKVPATTAEPVAPAVPAVPTQPATNACKCGVDCQCRTAANVKPVSEHVWQTFQEEVKPAIPPAAVPHAQSAIETDVGDVLFAAMSRHDDRAEAAPVTFRSFGDNPFVEPVQADSVMFNGWGRDTVLAH